MQFIYKNDIELTMAFNMCKEYINSFSGRKKSIPSFYFFN